MVRVQPGIDAKDLAAVYADSAVQRALSRDGKPAEPVDHPLVTFWSAWVSGRFAGAFMAVQMTAADIEVHSLLLRHSVRHSRELAKAFIDALFAIEGVTRITAWVLSSMGAAANFCRRMGFMLEGTRRGVCYIHGNAVHALMFGLQKSDWRAKWAL